MSKLYDTHEKMDALADLVTTSIYGQLFSPTANPAIIRARTAELAATLERQFTERPVLPSTQDAPDHIYLGASFAGAARKCPRKAWYKVRNYPKGALRPDAKLKFMIGDATEAVVLVAAQQAGLCVENINAKIEVPVSTTMTVRGELDCTIEGAMFDVKSASPFAWKKFEKLQTQGSLGGFDEFYTKDDFGYIDQLDWYDYGVYGQDRKRDISGGGWVAVEKVLGKVASPVIEMQSGEAFEGELVHYHDLEKVLRNSSQEPRQLPTKPHNKGGNLQLGINCSYCDYKEHCWRKANGGEGIKTYLYSNKPVDLVQIIKEPKVPLLNKGV